jgi:hypothetical protein
MLATLKGKDSSLLKQAGSGFVWLNDLSYVGGFVSILETSVVPHTVNIGRHKELTHFALLRKWEIGKPYLQVPKKRRSKTTEIRGRSELGPFFARKS